MGRNCWPTTPSRGSKNHCRPRPTRRLLPIKSTQSKALPDRPARGAIPAPAARPGRLLARGVTPRTERFAFEQCPGTPLLRHGDFVKAETLLRTAIQTLTRLNGHPYDGEPFYNLGLALRFQHRFDEAYAALYKAIWSYAWKSAGYYALAELDARRGDYQIRAGTCRKRLRRPRKSKSP